VAPYSLMTDEDGCGFVWRQPRNDAETHSLMTGCSSDPFSGFGWDGDQHWTPALVREWWSERENRTGGSRSRLVVGSIAHHLAAAAERDQ
jgi:hypothetical protein